MKTIRKKMFIFQYYIFANDEGKGIKDPHLLLERQNKVLADLTIELSRSTQERIALQEKIKDLENALAEKESEHIQQKHKQQKAILKLQEAVKYVENYFAEKEEQERKRQKAAFDQYEKFCQKLEEEMNLLMEIVIKNIRTLTQEDRTKLDSIGRYVKKSKNIF